MPLSRALKDRLIVALADVDAGAELIAALDEVTPGPWTDIEDLAPLFTNWAVQGGGLGDWHPLQYRIIGTGDNRVMEFRGAIGSTGAISDDKLFQLPEGFRPYSDTRLSLYDSSGALLTGAAVWPASHGSKPGEVESGATLTHPAYINFDGARFSIAGEV